MTYPHHENADGTVTFGGLNTDPRAQLDQALTAERERGTAPGENQAQTDSLDEYGSITPWDRLTQEAEKVITNNIVVPVPGDYRKGWEFVVNAIISSDQLERYTNQSRPNGKRSNSPGQLDDINSAQLNARILINHTTEVLVDGETLTNKAGRPIKLNSPEFMEIMKADTTVAALRKFIWDSHLGIMADRVMDAAGYSREGSNYIEVRPVNPTDD